MAKRKSRSNKKPEKKKMEKLDKEFNCPFCNHVKSVECELDKKQKYALVSCRICLESFHTSLTPLTEPIDVYSEWIDECERVNLDAALDLDGGDDRSGGVDSRSSKRMRFHQD